MNIQKRIRIVLITGLNNYWIADLIERFKSIPNLDFDDVIYWKSKRNALKNIKKNIKKHGIIYIPWKISKIVNNIILKIIYTQFEKLLYFKNTERDLFSICSDFGINIFKTNDIHSNECINFLQSLNCDLFAVCGSGILKKSIFELPTLGTINLHQGEVPKYRGAPPGFWELWSKEKQVGVTVHFVNEGVDTGDIILQNTVPIFEYDDYSSVIEKLSEISLSIYPEALRQIAVGKYKRIRQQQNIGKQYYIPTIWKMLLLQFRIKKRQFKFSIIIRNFVKKVIFSMALFLIYLRDSFLIYRGHRILSILYYHRVTNICQDGMTIGLNYFEKQIRFLKKHYIILSASDLNDWLIRKKDIKGKKVALITFDDGYEDNYKNALPILKRYSCPAIFFVSTAYIGNNRQFDHDKDLQPYLQFKKMDWSQLNDAMKYNIEIGVHSNSHPNLGKIPYEDAIHEIESSINKYIFYLKKKPIFMSYPFGGKKDMSIKVVDYIRNHKIINMLFLTFNNKNITPLDNFNLKRINISSKEKDLLTFWFKVEGGFRTLLYPYE